MRLSEIAFACYIYDRISDADMAYSDFLNATAFKPDLSDVRHRLELIRWLNRWGCRQFAKEYHALASSEIDDWFHNEKQLLPHINQSLLDLSNSEISSTGVAYARLMTRVASKRDNKQGYKSIVRIGPTGASKILFAIRPESLIPWDDPIRIQLQLGESAPSYSKYLRIARSELLQLGDECARYGYTLSELPQLLTRPLSTVAKLIDEYFWVTITRNCPSPGEEVLSQWASWG